MSNEENDLDAGMKCIKYMIFVTNFMFVVCIEMKIFN